MRRHRPAIGLLAIACTLTLGAAAATAPGGAAGTPAETAAPRDLTTLFPWQAPVSARGGRLARLALPAEVLARCRGDLSDLRLFDAAGGEVPFLVDSGPPAGRARVAERSVEPRILGVERQRLEPEGRAELWRESFELAPPPAPAGSGWDLVLATKRPRFVRKVEVAALTAGGGEETVVSGSLFRLDGERQRLRLPLPDTGDARLRVTLEGEDGPHLSPELRYESQRLVARGGIAGAEVPLEVLSVDSAGGRTVVELARPRGLVPDALVILTDTPSFGRQVEVWDEGPGAAEAPLGSELVYRVPAFAPVEELGLGVGDAAGDRLRLVIDDGDSPPLTNLEVIALVRRPTLLFTLPAAAGGGDAEGTLRFGGGRALTPRYDLAGLPGPGESATGEAAGIALALADPARAVPALLGPVTANPGFDPAPALAFALRPGASLDPDGFRYQRLLAVPPSPEGLVRLALQPEDLAVARPDLADLRLADGDDRQWAYLVEHDAAVERLALGVAGPTTEDGESRYRLTPDASPVAIERLTLTLAEPFFDRAFSLEAIVDGEARPLARGRLARRAGDPRPVEVAFARTRLDELELVIDDGDDAPLTLTAATARMPLPELYAALPEGDYRLLLGDPEAPAPRYELERVRGVVLAAAAVPAAAGPLAANPAHRRPLFGGAGVERLLLWSALLLAVAVLVVFTLRLARGG